MNTILYFGFRIESNAFYPSGVFILEIVYSSDVRIF